MKAAAVRVSCDSLVALGERSAGGRAIFAKNSDRPAGECQSLVHVPARKAAAGVRLRCQYIEIDDVRETYAFTGARPWWLWGLEHGVNERGVAIGNHTIFTRDAVSDIGLTGMDLVRLALERGASAAQAAEVIIELIERHGQGGSGYHDAHWPYHNSFLIADAREALLLEASASRWALKKAPALSASNHASIGTDWERLGHDTIEHAIARDWWTEPTSTRFDFAGAYRSTEVVPPVVSSGRYATTCSALANGQVDVAAIQRVMRDHYGSGDVHLPGATPEDERYFSVCMHADPIGTTTASMVIELHGDERRPLLAWMALTSPCVAPYLPVFVGVPLPPDLARGGEGPETGGAWHGFKALLGEVEKDFARRAPVVRDFWKEFERDLVADTLRAIAGLPSQGEARTRAQREIMDASWQRTRAALGQITATAASL